MFPQSLVADATRPKEFEDRSSSGTCRDISLDFFSRGPCHGIALRLWGKGGFTLLELLVVMGIIALLMVLVVPAFTNIKSAGDVTSAASTVKGVLDQARTYAMANNTYTWVGFYEEDVSQPSTTPQATAGTGRLVMSIVASKDGTTVYDSSSTSIDPAKLVQIGKLIKIDNVHLPLLTVGTGTGTTFDARPAPSPNPVNDSRFGEINAGSPTAPTTNSKFPFQYPLSAPPPGQYTFRKTLQFNPRGESRINSGLGVGGVTYDVRRVVEIGLLPTHGTFIPTPTPSAGKYPNAVASQFIHDDSERIRRQHSRPRRAGGARASSICRITLLSGNLLHQ